MIHMTESITNIDGAILLWIQENIRNDILSPVVKFITHLGDHGWIWIALTIACLVFAKTRRTGIFMMFSLLGSLLINNMILKNLVARIRPYEVVEGLHRIIEAQGDLSFPSGHTGSSFAAAVVIFCTCPKKYGVPVMVLAGLISLSRLYVGVHYPTDVLAGALTGTLIAIAVCKGGQRLMTAWQQRDA